MVGIYCSKLVHEFKNSTELLKVASGARGHKSCCGATLKYFWLPCNPVNPNFYTSTSHITKYLHNIAPNWTQLKFLTPLCMGFGTKLCRELRCFRVKFYVANHALLVPHFNPPKSHWCQKKIQHYLTSKAIL